MTEKPKQVVIPHHHQPDTVECSSDLELQNGHKFKKGETYDVFQTQHPQTPFCVGQNRTALSQLDPDTFHAHFNGLTITPHVTLPASEYLNGG